MVGERLELRVRSGEHRCLHSFLTLIVMPVLRHKYQFLPLPTPNVPVREHIWAQLP